MKNLLSITYQSRELLCDPAKDVERIVAESKLRNRVNGITGILCFDGAFFLHTIEGLPEKIESLFMSLADDHRHALTGWFTRECIEERDFPEWDMQFIEPCETVRIVPDMKNFRFSYRRLREIHAMAAGGARQMRRPMLN